MKISMINEAMKLKSAIPATQYRERVISAYLAAAVGDALGWPFEGHAKVPPKVEKWDGNYIRWEKRGGTRFRPSLELVEAGAYSDDTQLILAVTRSRLQSGIDWWAHLSTCELPFWTFYERGGGGATKRAAASWLSSVPPWRASKEDSIRKYFSAGGNGVAMRVLPHCVAGISCESFEPIALEILTDGVITHGHPRALVGALAYGYALWYALKLNKTLGFGELIAATISNIEVWGQQHSVVERWHDWAACANRNGDYASVWQATVAETLDLLKSTDHAIQAGALSLDDEILDAIGARNSKVSGAGTVSAGAAIYFSSRYAASPLEGLRRAASAVGTDTDTVASMTGALLGALVDTGWLGKYIATLQDSLYIKELASAMSTGADIYSVESKPVKKADLVRLSLALSTSISLKGVRLPNGLTVEKISKMEFDDPKNYQPYWNIFTSDGLKIFVKTPSFFSVSSKANKYLEDSKVEKAEIEEYIEEANAVVGLSLVVSSLDNSLVFYQDILGLRVSGRSGKVLRFGEHLAFKEEPKFTEGIRPVTIYIRVKALDKLRERLVDLKYPNLSAVVDNPKRRSFTCIDPDGYMVEIINDK